ncbi:MAG: hypothetical protein DRH57_07165 [Candidatus Cloacimonadota bacterium]|nr:MAG: hypothetical protein DRH57_07165 [Candidatus Cloacimonadota bacterium]
MLSKQKFEEIVEQYAKQILNYIYKLSIRISREDAEDLTQQVFISLYHHKDRIDHTRNIKSYIFTIAHNKAINFLNSRNYNKSRLTLSLDNHHSDKHLQLRYTLKDKDTPEILFQKEKRNTTILKLLDELPIKQKTAIILQHYHNFNYKEIAEYMNITKSAVESLIFRAKEKLRKKLRKYRQFFPELL